MSLNTWGKQVCNKNLRMISLLNYFESNVSYLLDRNDHLTAGIMFWNSEKEGVMAKLLMRRRNKVESIYSINERFLNFSVFIQGYFSAS